MFGTIRRHQKWLWLIIVVVTVASFVVFFNPSSRNGGGGGGRGGANLGSVSGTPITVQDYRLAQAEAYLQYFLNHGEWPDKDSTAKQYGFDQQRDTYLRLFYQSKFKEYDIQISEDAVNRLAGEILRGLGRNGAPVSLDDFDKQILTPRGYTVADFKHFLQDELALRQLISVVGMSGTLVTTNEAMATFQVELQEMATEAVFFAPSNYLGQVSCSPEELGRFYTNQLPRYRLPDRVQVSYVKFNLTNYLGAADAQIAKLTNFDNEVDALYNQRGGTNYYTDAKSPADAKAKIKEEQRRRFALFMARTNATTFAEEVMSHPSDLDKAATAHGLSAGVTAPFDAQRGPSDLNVPATFTHAAFKITADDPVAGPLPADDGMYVITLARKLPSENPSQASIASTVMEDCKYDKAARLAYVNGTNFAAQAAAGLAQGKTFAALASEAGHKVTKIPPFSLSSRSLPESDSLTSLARLQEVAMSLPTGHSSGLVQTEFGGGMVLYVAGRTAGDLTKLKTDFPAFLARTRSTRQGEAFNAWLGREAERALRDTPLIQQRQQQQAQAGR